MAELTYYVGTGSIQAEWVLTQLLERGADPGQAGEKEVTPLMLASAAGQEWLMRLLLDAGALVDAQDAAGRTALAYACRWGQGGAVEVLLAHHTPVNTLDSQANLPIFYAAQNAHYPILLSLMVQLAFFMCSS
ncbi:hypothetical protein Pcinc_030239 [Petrolisthes cinctipes]|nr:hypothetical protein Pcinc_030239 [Petrolisthes cinctipes]